MSDAPASFFPQVVLVDENDRINFLLPFPPSANTYWRHNRGHVHVSAKARAYRQEIRIRCRMPGPLTERLHILLQMHHWRKSGWDIDNHVKVLLDALEKAGVYENDEQVDRLSIQRGQHTKKPGLVCVEIRILKDCHRPAAPEH